jgi:DNA-binding transcriptional ArsR family regulator
MTTRGTVRLSGARELGALVSPLRVEIVELLQARGPSSIAELARELSRTPHSLYYHVHALARARLLIERERRKVGKREEIVWALAAERFEIERAPTSPLAVRALERSGAALLRRAERELCRSIRSGADEHSMLGARRARLDRAGLARVQRALDALDRTLAREHERGRGRAHLCTFVLTPIVERGAKARRRGRP